MFWIIVLVAFGIVMGGMFLYLNKRTASTPGRKTLRRPGVPDKGKPHWAVKSLVQAELKQDWQAYTGLLAQSFVEEEAAKYSKQMQQEISPENFRNQFLPKVMANNYQDGRKLIDYSIGPEKYISEFERCFSCTYHYKTGKAVEPEVESEDVWTVMEGSKWKIAFSGNDPVPQEARRAALSYLECIKDGRGAEAFDMLAPSSRKKKAETTGQKPEEYKKDFTTSLKALVAKRKDISYEILRQKCPAPMLINLTVDFSFTQDGQANSVREDYLFIQEAGKWYALLPD
ncbi:hypothetical protein ACFL54_02205 [Planctomycetota bacterium]